MTHELTEGSRALAGERPAPIERVRVAFTRVSPTAIGVAGVVAFGLLALILAIDARVRGLSAVPDLARGIAAAVLLFAVAGEGVTRRFLPDSMQALRPLFVVPVGAAVASLALTALGFAAVPIEVSIGVVLAGGLGASLLTRTRRHGRALPPIDRRALVFGALAALIVAMALIPAFRGGRATVPGENPDAHLVTGVAVLLQEAPPWATRAELPIDEMPDVWQSRYAIFYALAAVSKLSGLDPIETFPAMVALLSAFVALGFGLLAVYVLGLSPPAGALVTGLLGLDALTLHVALHPYWNQLWGLSMLPFTLLFAWWTVAHRHRGAGALFALTLLLAALAYPLMLPYPLIALAGFAFVLRRRPPLPQWSRRRWLVTGVVLSPVLAVPVLGALQKLASGYRALSSPNADLYDWIGDVTEFFPLGAFISTGGGFLPFLAVTALAVVGLRYAVTRPVAVSLGILLGLSLFATARLRTLDFATYFDFKHLSFVGPILITLAIVGMLWVMGRRHPAAVGLGAAALLAYSVATVGEFRQTLSRNAEQVTSEMAELREWSADLPKGASVRLDIPPSGIQLWAGYLMSAHPLTAPAPVRGAIYPHAPEGFRADYSLSLAVVPRSDPGRSRPFPTPPGAVDPPLRRNLQFVLRRLARSPGPDTASQRMVPGLSPSQERRRRQRRASSTAERSSDATRR